jgi:hypothetical protein
MIGLSKMLVVVVVGALLAFGLAACGGQAPAPPSTSPVARPAAAPPEAPTPGDAYVCPMHPEVVSGTPARCPKCGMDLVPKDQAAAMSPETAAAAHDPHAGHNH